MPKVIQMPRRTQQEDQVCIAHRSMILPDVSEESESLARIQRWLEMADAALEDKLTVRKERPAS
jgi:hypothetical protein